MSPAGDLAGAQQQPSPGPGQPSNDLVLVNGRIHTMDARNTVARSVTIRSGRFVAVGNRAPVGRRGPRAIDLRGRTVVPGLIEPHVHIVSLANRPGYHTILENTTSIREIQETLAARRKSVPEGQWITSMGGWHPNQWAEHRHPTLKELDEAVPDRPVLLYERFTGPCVDQQLGKQFFDAADAGAPPHPELSDRSTSPTTAPSRRRIGRRRPVRPARSSSCAGCRPSRTSGAARWTRWPIRPPLGLTAHLDQVLFPTPGPLHPNQILSNLDHYRMYDSWLALHREGRALVRLQMNFLHNQNDPALPELKERLRNQFQFFGDDMLMTGSIGEWAAPLGAGAVVARGAAPGGAGRMAQREQRPEPGGADAGGRGVRGGEQGVRHHAAALVVHHVPDVTRRTCCRGSRRSAAACRWRAFRWVTSTDPKVVVGPPFRTICRPRHPGGHPRRRRAHRAAEPVAAHLLRRHGRQLVRRAGQRRPAAHARRGAAHCSRAATAGSCGWRTRSGRSSSASWPTSAVLDRDYFTVPDADIKKVRSLLTVVDGRVVHESGPL